MKTNEFGSLIFNPFKRIAGWEAFGIGLVIVVLTTFTGNFAGIYFDGVIDMHFAETFDSLKSWLMIPVNIISISVIMWLAGITVSKNFRFIDILGTMTLSRAPFLLIALASFFVKVPDLSGIMQDPFVIFDSISFIIILIFTFPIIIWSVTLMYNAYKISTGASGQKLNISFIFGLIVAEIITKIIIYQIDKFI
ncbi:MAG: hypothetical protein JXR27_02425 [Paludibacteraceae bacterium]|nr:hypothetical protein [Paludibacteraceae bacterium]